MICMNKVMAPMKRLVFKARCRFDPALRRQCIASIVGAVSKKAWLESIRPGQTDGWSAGRWAEFKVLSEWWRPKARA